MHLKKWLTMVAIHFFRKNPTITQFTVQLVMIFHCSKGNSAGGQNKQIRLTYS